MFLPETFGLELRVPRAKVRQVLSVPGGTNHRVLVEVEPAEGPAFRIELHLRSPEEFRIAMAT